MNNRRFARFSIATLLLFTALIACSISHFLVSRELINTKRALTSLRNDALVLDSDDDSLLHVIALPTYGELQWRWKMQLPIDGTYRLRYAFDEIPLSGFPIDSKAINAAFLGSDGNPIAGGVPFQVEIAIFKDNDRGWQILASNGERGTSIPIENPPSWLDSYKAIGWGSFVSGTGKTFSTSADTRMTLINRRKSKVIAGGSTVETKPADGLSVWVERVD